MKFIVHVHNHNHSDSKLDEILKQLSVNTLTLKQMAKTAAEHAAEIVTIKDQVVKSKAEILAKIQALEDAIANAGNTTPEVDAAMEELKAEVQAVDDINPDAPVPTPEP